MKWQHLNKKLTLRGVGLSATPFTDKRNKMQLNKLLQSTKTAVEFKPTFLDANDQVIESDMILLVNHASDQKCQQVLLQNAVNTGKIKALKKTATDEAKINRAKQVMETSEGNDIKAMASVVVGWSGVTDNGVEVVFSTEILEQILSSDFAKTWIADQTVFDKEKDEMVTHVGLSNFVADNKNFFS